MKKVYLILSILLLVLLTACGDIATKTGVDELKDEVSSVDKQIEDIADSNKNKDAGKYITPSEDDFYWTDVEGGVSVDYYYGTDTAIIIPETLGGKPVVQITAELFYEIQPTGVKLPDSLVTIGDETFYYCTELLEVSFGKGLKEIGKSSFEGCVSLKSVEFPDGFERIGESAFANCTSLKSVKLPDGLKYIETGAFVLSGIENVTIPGSVECLSSQAFVLCDSLETVTVESGVSKMEERVFETCTSLKKCELPDTVTEMDYNIFYQCEEVTVHAPAGSFAEQYAKENKVNFKAN